MPLRRVAIPMAALAALLVPAAPAAVAKKKVKKPRVTSITPKAASIGQTMTIRGRHFVRGKGRNSVVFKRDGARAVFIKADISTPTKMEVVLSDKLADFLLARDGVAQPTTFRVRILAKRFGRRFTSLARSPKIGPRLPEQPETPAEAAADGDCDGDNVINGTDTDDDNDLLSDTLEKTLKTDGCKRDSDGDGVEDGYEYKSAVDLNDDEYQNPNVVLPYPSKRPYPNPLDGTDAKTDFDGDSLTLADEYYLWGITAAGNRTLEPLTYSDGMQHSVYQRGGDGRRRPSLAAVGYNRHQEFLAWANAAGYNTVPVADVFSPWYEDRTVLDIRDFDRSGTVSTADDSVFPEVTYYDFDGDGWLDDSERDEDADGLTNFMESTGCMSSASYWSGVYDKETPYPVVYAGTKLDDPDSDGDGVRDGADDADHDDMPNMMECSRISAGAPLPEPDEDGKIPPPLADWDNPAWWVPFVNPFNPCLPSIYSRTCATKVPTTNAWAPFNPDKDEYYWVKQ